MKSSNLSILPMTTRKKAFVVSLGVGLFGLFYSENAFASGEKYWCQFSIKENDTVEFQVDTAKNKISIQDKSNPAHIMEIYSNTFNFVKAYGNDAVLVINKNNGEFIRLSSIVTGESELKEDIKKGTCFEVFH